MHHDEVTRPVKKDRTRVLTIIIKQDTFYFPIPLLQVQLWTAPVIAWPLQTQLSKNNMPEFHSTNNSRSVCMYCTGTLGPSCTPAIRSARSKNICISTKDHRLPKASQYLMSPCEKRKKKKKKISINKDGDSVMHAHAFHFPVCVRREQCINHTSSRHH